MSEKKESEIEEAVVDTDVDEIARKLEEDGWAFDAAEEEAERKTSTAIAVKEMDVEEVEALPDIRREPSNYYLRNLGNKIHEPLCDALRLVEKNEFRIEGLDDEVALQRAMVLCYLQRSLEKGDGNRNPDEEDPDAKFLDDVDETGLTDKQYKRVMALQEQIRKTVETANRIKEEVVFGHKEIRRFMDEIFRIIIDAAAPDRKLADKIISKMVGECMLTVKKISTEQRVGR